MKDHVYHLYIDEIYNPNLIHLSKQSKKEIITATNHHHFGIAGVIVPMNGLIDINFTIRRFQKRFYKEKNNTILHYVDILHSRDVFSDLKINSDKQARFIASLCNHLTNFEYKLLFAFIDNHALINKYGVFTESETVSSIKKIKYLFPKMNVKDYNLYYLALRLLLSQFFEFLVRTKARGIIIAESRGRVEDRNLRNAFDLIQKTGVNKISPREIRSLIPEMFIIDKSQNHAGLQIADLLLYPTYDFFVPNHRTRNDHFISKSLIMRKLYKGSQSITIFP